MEHLKPAQTLAAQAHKSLDLAEPIHGKDNGFPAESAMTDRSRPRQKSRDPTRPDPAAQNAPEEPFH